MKRLFFTGLISLLPLALTLLIVNFVLNILTAPFQGLTENILAYYNLLNSPLLFLSADQVLYFSSRIMALALLFGIVILMGFLARHVVVKTIFRFGETLITHIPFVNRVYKVVHDAIDSVFGPKGAAFSQAVFVPYPHDDALSIGLITKKQTPEDHDEELFVFVPGALNPTFGLMLSYKYEDIQFTDMKVDEAIKAIVSCGVMLEIKN